MTSFSTAFYLATSGCKSGHNYNYTSKLSFTGIWVILLWNILTHVSFNATSTKASFEFPNDIGGIIGG